MPKAQHIAGNVYDVVIYIFNESPAEKKLKIGPHLPVIIKHQVAYFLGTAYIPFYNTQLTCML